MVAVAVVAAAAVAVAAAAAAATATCLDPLFVELLVDFLVEDASKPVCFLA